eukprot:7329055-Alexandrium_andersonii.AAC.1
MSASLVGSEMCIRDSFQQLPALPLRGGLRAKKHLRRHVPKAPFLGEGAVSYTHLTLPTICSV